MSWQLQPMTRRRRRWTIGEGIFLVAGGLFILVNDTVNGGLHWFDLWVLGIVVSGVWIAVLGKLTPEKPDPPP